jgi:hypothetical protein
MKSVTRSSHSRWRSDIVKSIGTLLVLNFAGHSLPAGHHPQGNSGCRCEAGRRGRRICDARYVH